MSRRLPLGTWFGLTVTFSGWALVNYLALMPVLAAPAAWLLSLSLLDSLLAGAASALILALADLVHQLGHAYAARRVGHPMTGIHFYSLFSGSVYPEDEPALPPRVHIARALGGFWVNVAMGLALTPVALALWPGGGVLAWAAASAVVCNLFIVGLGALLPIDIPGVFTIDGGTILRHWRQMRKDRRA